MSEFVQFTKILESEILNLYLAIQKIICNFQYLRTFSCAPASCNMSITKLHGVFFVQKVHSCAFLFSGAVIFATKNYDLLPNALKHAFSLRLSSFALVNKKPKVEKRCNVHSIIYRCLLFDSNHSSPEYHRQ